MEKFSGWEWKWSDWKWWQMANILQLPRQPSDPCSIWQWTWKWRHKNSLRRSCCTRPAVDSRPRLNLRQISKTLVSPRHQTYTDTHPIIHHSIVLHTQRLRGPPLPSTHTAGNTIYLPFQEPTTTMQTIHATIGEHTPFALSVRVLRQKNLRRSSLPNEQIACAAVRWQWTTTKAKENITNK